MKLKLNVGNLVPGVNTWAKPLLNYLAPFISCSKCEFLNMDRKTYKHYTVASTQILM